MKDIIDVSKGKIAALAKVGHATCHGTGIASYKPGSRMINLCSCVLRALEKKGWRTGEDLEPYIGQGQAS